MLSRAACIACLALALASAPARAGNLADFNAAVEKAQSHGRVAIGYLRTGNTDLASVELDRLREAWRALQQRFAGRPPDAFDGVALYGRLWTVVDAWLVAADLMLTSGRPEAARQSLDAIGGDLYALRKAAGVTVLADCVRDSNAALDALLSYDDRAIDWSKAETGFDIAQKSAVYRYVLVRCDGMASDAVHADPEFRRLIDGAKASLTFIPKAVEERDSDLLHRVLIELRAFDRLLAFRYG